MRETKLNNFRAKAKGKEVRNGSVGSFHCSFVELSSHPDRLAQVDDKSVFSINPANTFYPPLVIP